MRTTLRRSSPRFWALLALSAVAALSSAVRPARGFQVGVCDGTGAALSGGGAVRPARDVAGVLDCGEGGEVEARPFRRRPTAPPTPSADGRVPSRRASSHDAGTVTSPSVAHSFIGSRWPGATASMRDFHGTTSWKAAPAVNTTVFTASPKKNTPLMRRTSLGPENEGGGRGGILFPETMQQILSTSTILMVNLARFLSTGQKKKLMLVFLRSLSTQASSVTISARAR